MACLNMFNNEQQQQQTLYNTMNPRISFSNDFIDPQHPIKLENSYRDPPVSSDFQFSVPDHNMISADKLFSNGKMLPLKENGARTTTTIRGKVPAGDTDYEDASPRFSKGASRWKERLGLKRSTFSYKKANKSVDGSLECTDEMKIPVEAYDRCVKRVLLTGNSL